MDEEEIDGYLYGEEAAKVIRNIEVPPSLNEDKECDTINQRERTAHEKEVEKPEEEKEDEGPHHTEEEQNNLEDTSDEDDEDIEIIIEDTNRNFTEDKSTSQVSSRDEKGDHVALPAASTFNLSHGNQSAPQTQQSTTIGSLLNAGGAANLNYEGKNIFQLDLDGLEDKPWRKPGADITDYFNFGFDENTWKLYCQKQKSLRDETLLLKKIQVHDSSESVKKPRHNIQRNDDVRTLSDSSTTKSQNQQNTLAKTSTINTENYSTRNQQNINAPSLSYHNKKHSSSSHKGYHQTPHVPSFSSGQQSISTSSSSGLHSSKEQIKDTKHTFTRSKTRSKHYSRSRSRSPKRSYEKKRRQ